ncbi:ubiquitin-conjugating enzyme E2 H-like [Condylostylus longicornis]|uniref:ubiquitin-conjugating enzyme E2 H-like n=1 Tax=Condylostylus longicornis TaxID=2530218 RepID=UPI00244E09A8|nr:ubiquitin-conjugating enzyme E2 H-like [Condylostylus longicornis]
MSLSNQKRMDKDIMKLIENGYDVTFINDINEFMVKFYGPKGSLYEGGLWRIRVFLPENYPFKSPSIGFINKIFHPNIDETSGTVCLDVINQSWTPLYDLFNIFEIFLPQLLTYPNPIDPLNKRAAVMCLQNIDDFRKEVIEYVKKFASVKIKQNNDLLENLENDDNNSELSISDLSTIDEE